MRRSILAISAMFLLFMGVTTVEASSSRDACGSWEGKINFSEKTSTGIKVDLTRNEKDELSGNLELPGGNGERLNLLNIRTEGTLIEFELKNERTTASFKGVLNRDGSTLTGEFMQAGKLYPFEMSRRPDNLSSGAGTSGILK